jgi:hypothetical protein
MITNIQRFWIAALSMSATWLVLFVCCIMWNTLMYVEPPVEFDDGYAYAWNDDHNDMTIAYHRDVIIHKTTTAEIHREVVCYHNGSEEVYDLQPLTREYVAGTEKNIQRLVSYPTPQPVGTHCTLKTNVKWWPTFSMSAHVIPMTDIDFVVQASPQGLQ